MSEDTHLTPIQTKVLIALTRSATGSLNPDEILLATGIATSTWSAEQGRLVSMGLIKKQMIRVIKLNQISKRMNYGLTEKGRMIGQNLLNISKILGENSGEISFARRVEDEDQVFGSQIAECVEVALDSFGSNLVNLVKSSLEIEHQIPWKELSERSDVFEEVLRDYFGVGAAEKLKKLIAANIESRFEVRAKDSHSGDLALLISVAKQRSAGKKTKDIDHLGNSAKIEAGSSH
jgi:DNA-binding MarR family transcriptional regulator